MLRASEEGLPSFACRFHQQDAFVVSKWLQGADADGSLEKYFHPNMELQDRKKATIEGWILGVL